MITNYLILTFQHLCSILVKLFSSLCARFHCLSVDIPRHNVFNPAYWSCGGALVSDQELSLSRVSYHVFLHLVGFGLVPEESLSSQVLV